MTLIRFTAAVAITISATAAFAADDRAPTAAERSSIEAALKAAGYSAWEEIELDDKDGWEIDDATFADGKKYDLTLDPSTLAITSRDD